MFISLVQKKVFSPKWDLGFISTIHSQSIVFGGNFSHIPIFLKALLFLHLLFYLKFHCSVQLWSEPSSAKWHGVMQCVSHCVSAIFTALLMVQRHHFKFNYCFFLVTSSLIIHELEKRKENKIPLTLGLYQNEQRHLKYT